jgi:putative NADH-flavin reductase
MTQTTFLVFGATGQTGQHFVSLALAEGHRVRALARTPAKLAHESPDLVVQQGSITAVPNLDDLVAGVDVVVSMLGDVTAQKHTKVNTAFVRQLIPAMRRQGVERFFYQAGALSRPPQGRLPPPLWAIRNTLARGYAGQHEDNEAVMEYLSESARDVQWTVHRAGIGSDGPSKGVLERTATRPSVGTFADCAAYNYRIVMDSSAVHTCDLSRYRK